MHHQKLFIKAYLFLLIIAQSTSAQKLSIENAYQLSQMPLRCITQEWPNKTSHLSDSISDHKLLPSQLHPSFYGCLDWHSSVHGHWMLVKLLKTFPDLTNADSIIRVLDNSFQSQKIEDEVVYFSKYTGSKTFERTYGWAWLLKLDEELKTWNNPLGKRWHKTLQPLTKCIVSLWKDFLPKQTYPNRTGVHPNTAFGLAFALDWARSQNDTAFEKSIINKSMEFYAEQKNIPAYFEPDGSDFFSPSLQAADLMRRIYDGKKFSYWFKRYLNKESINRLLELPVVSDRTDYQLVHLDGLSFSRAWCLKGIASCLQNSPGQVKKFNDKATFFINSSFDKITHENYGGSHWLASFAVYAMLN
jgi:hypothetical protein